MLTISVLWLLVFLAKYDFRTPDKVSQERLKDVVEPSEASEEKVIVPEKHVIINALDNEKIEKHIREQSAESDAKDGNENKVEDFDEIKAEEEVGAGDVDPTERVAEEASIKETPAARKQAVVKNQAEKVMND